MRTKPLVAAIAAALAVPAVAWAATTVRPAAEHLPAAQPEARQLTPGRLAELAAGTPAALIPPRPDPSDVSAGLARVAAASDGRVRLAEIGRSNDNRPLRLASVGTGPTRLLYVTQQHGNEPVGTPAAVRALWALGVPDTPWHRWLRSRVTLDVVVQANPDGAVRGRRENADPTATGEYSEPGVGYDVNRHHNPATPIGRNPVPEAVAVLRQWQATRPALVVDYHMQARFGQPDGRETTASVLWPTSPLAGADAVNRSRQLAVANVDAMTRYAGANVTRYPGGDYAGIARNGYGILGSATLLVEFSILPPEQAGRQLHGAFTSMLTTAQGAADGSLWAADPVRADAVPPRGPQLPGEEGAAAHVDNAA